MDTLELNLAIAGKISEALKREQKSVAWLSQETGISYSTTTRIVSGAARVTMGELSLIARALKVSTGALLPKNFGE
jgi:DNA-binding Xre family transcriptional regulator